MHSLDGEEWAGYLGRELSVGAEAFSVDRSREKVQLDKVAGDAPIVNLVNSFFIEAIRQRASDVHIESFQNTAQVRYRIDGVLKVASEVSVEQFPAISSRIKIMANLNIMENRRPQDGRISLELGGRSVDMRVSIVPITGGESIVLRIFNREGDVLELEELGFPEEQRLTLEKLAREKNGLVLVTGPTGSGKTTTLNALLRKMDCTGNKVITIEDPVENVIEGIDQIQTNEAIGLSFESILRRVLRQDPDVVMIGEIRDKTTADLAIRAALTGHLVLATLHTNSALGALSRLIDMGIESFLLAAVFRGALAQRLVRKLCPLCKKADTPGPAEAAFLERYGAPGKLFRPQGCPQCDDIGYKGRIALAEVFTKTPELEERITRQDSNRVILEYLKTQGYKNMAESGCGLVTQGETTLAELERTVEF